MKHCEVLLSPALWITLKLCEIISIYFSLLQEVVEFLLESGAEVDCLNIFGVTPFFLALEGLHKNIGQVQPIHSFLFSCRSIRSGIKYMYMFSCFAAFAPIFTAFDLNAGMSNLLLWWLYL